MPVCIKIENLLLQGVQLNLLRIHKSLPNGSQFMMLHDAWFMYHIFQLKIVDVLLDISVIICFLC